jgi:hypothetical protein
MPSQDAQAQPASDSLEQEEPNAYSTIRKTITLPKDADIDAIQISYADGVLRITAAKKSANVAEEVDEEMAGMEAEVRRKRERWETLRCEMEEERESVLEAEVKLREAKVAKRQKIASERRQLSITQ